MKKSEWFPLIKYSFSVNRWTDRTILRLSTWITFQISCFLWLIIKKMDVENEQIEYSINLFFHVYYIIVKIMFYNEWTIHSFISPSLNLITFQTTLFLTSTHNMVSFVGCSSIIYMTRTDNCVRWKVLHLRNQLTLILSLKEKRRNNI